MVHLITVFRVPTQPSDDHGVSTESGSDRVLTNATVKIAGTCNPVVTARGTDSIHSDSLNIDVTE